MKEGGSSLSRHDAQLFVLYTAEVPRRHTQRGEVLQSTGDNRNTHSCSSVRGIQRSAARCYT